jgi:hypothetical protein
MPSLRTPISSPTPLEARLALFWELPYFSTC